MKLKNKIIPGPNGQGFYILGGKPTADPKRSICLMNVLGGEADYSLWNVEVSDEEDNIELWPYEEEDSENIKKQLLEKFVETAFENN